MTSPEPVPDEIRGRKEALFGPATGLRRYWQALPGRADETLFAEKKLMECIGICCYKDQSFSWPEYARSGRQANLG